MLWGLNKTHTEHLSLLESVNNEVVQKLCQAAVDSIVDGSKSFDNLGALGFDADHVRKLVGSLVFVYVECCRANVSAERIVEYLTASKVKDEHVATIANEYRVKKSSLSQFCMESDNLFHYQDVQWRFEAKIGSRSLLNQMVPLVSMDWRFGDAVDAAEAGQLVHEVVETDPATLVRMADSLERALHATRSRHIRKAEKQLKKLALDL